MKKRLRNTYVINENMDPAVLVKAIKDLSQENAKQVIEICSLTVWGRFTSSEGRTARLKFESIPGYQKWVDKLYSRPSTLQKQLWIINELLGTHGTEIICLGDNTSPQRMDGSDIVLEYCNAGNTYMATVAYEYRNDRFVLTSWGDWVENHSRLTRNNTNSDDY